MTLPLTLQMSSLHLNLFVNQTYVYLFFYVSEVLMIETPSLLKETCNMSEYSSAPVTL